MRIPHPTRARVQGCLITAGVLAALVLGACGIVVWLWYKNLEPIDRLPFQSRLLVNFGTGAKTDGIWQIGPGSDKRLLYPGLILDAASTGGHMVVAHGYQGPWWVLRTHPAARQLMRLNRNYQHLMGWRQPSKCFVIWDTKEQSFRELRADGGVGPRLPIRVPTFPRVRKICVDQANWNGRGEGVMAVESKDKGDNFIGTFLVARSGSLKKIPEHGIYVNPVLSPDGTQVAADSGAGWIGGSELVIFDTHTWRCRAIWKPWPAYAIFCASYFYSLAWSADGKWIVVMVASPDSDVTGGYLCVVNSATGKAYSVLATLRGDSAICVVR